MRKNSRTRYFKPITLFHKRLTAQYQSRIDLHRKALQAIHRVLPKKLALQAHDCVINDRKLLIYTHSAAWASQLRFYSRELQSSVSSAILRPIDKVQLRILHQRVEKAVHRTANIPALENIELIRGNALSTPDSKLKSALLNLSHTLRRSYEGA